MHFVNYNFLQVHRYSEIAFANILSFAARMIPFCENNQAVRNIYSSVVSTYYNFVISKCFKSIHLSLTSTVQSVIIESINFIICLLTYFTMLCYYVFNLEFLLLFLISFPKLFNIQFKF